MPSRRSKKIFVVYYQPTAESWYFTTKRLARDAVKKLNDFDLKHNMHYDTDISEYVLDPKIL